MTPTAGTAGQESQTQRRPAGRPTSQPGVGGASLPTAAEPEVVAVPNDLSTGRLLAFHALTEYETHGRFLQDSLATADQRHQLPAAQRALAVDLASGVIRRQRTLDCVLQAMVTRPRYKVEPELWRLLRIGAWQLMFGRTPDHAAVDTTVQLCRHLDRDRWTGFVNGVLRGIGRALTGSTTQIPSATAYPLADGNWGLLNQDFFPSPQSHRAQFIAQAFSLPDELANRWSLRLPDADLWCACFHSISQPRLTLRCNRLQSSPQAIIEEMVAAGVHAEGGALEASIMIRNAARIDRLPGFSEGRWSVQDEAAMNVGRLLQPVAGEQILDLCAAPGGKATHLAELSDDSAKIVACDVTETRLQKIVDGSRRLQLSSVTAVLVNRDGSDLPEGPFDAVLVDVPCSNTGVLSRRPEVRWRFNEAEILDLIPLQTRLLLHACSVTRPGGRVVYSTCSIEPEENRGVIDAVLQAFPNFRIDREILHLPGQPADGAYQALLIHHPAGSLPDRAEQHSGRGLDARG